MKKLLPILMSALMVFSLASCGESDKSSSSAPESAVSSAIEESGETQPESSESEPSEPIGVSV